MKIGAHIIGVTIIVFLLGCNYKNQQAPKSSGHWVIDSQEEWYHTIEAETNLRINEGKLEPTDSVATFKTILKSFPQKKSFTSVSVFQSPDWLNWDSVPNIGPSNLGDAPVALQLGRGNYWMFGRYQKSKGQKEGTFHAMDTTLKGFDIGLKTTLFENQFDAPGGLQPGKGGYHAWQSKDMVHWVHHGPVSEEFSKWVTTAEYVDGKLYLYYDFPNDQDPHLYIDEDLTDGMPGKNMGMAFNDPTHGSDCAVIRDLEGNFHLIVEDWSPIDASTHAWDSPLAVHAVSSDGIGDFEILAPPLDERTNATGRFAEYPHPHWHAEAPERFPAKMAEEDVPQYRIKKGDKRAFATYEIHEPDQNAYGDWASISIGDQYYLFADFDPAGGHGTESMRVAWFTSNNINEPFRYCGSIGQGHPDPEIVFAEDKFYLLTQMDTDYISSGPWVEKVELRVGLDTDNDGETDQWGNWHEVFEKYTTIEGFAKQIARQPAKMNFSGLPEAYGIQVEVKITQTTINKASPIIDKMEISF